MSLIQLVDVKKDYAVGELSVPALRGVSFEVGEGEFLGIMGASGSGKSTLLNILGCMDRPTNGMYLLDGEDVSKLDKNSLAEIRNKKIGLVFQNFNLLERLTARENVELPLLYAGVRAGERSQRAAGILELLGLGDRVDHYPSQLSGGEQQRVAIARALAGEPKILLADEPTGNLDSERGKELMQELKKLNRERRLTVILVTHDQEIAQWSDRIVVIKDGKIIQEKRNR